MEKIYNGPPTMKVGQLIKQLSEFHPDMDIEVHAEGHMYPVLIAQTLDENTVEIGCGWVEIEYL